MSFKYASFQPNLRHLMAFLVNSLQLLSLLEVVSFQFQVTVTVNFFCSQQKYVPLLYNVNFPKIKLSTLDPRPLIRSDIVVQLYSLDTCSYVQIYTYK